MWREADVGADEVRAGASEGILAGTPIATPAGWRDVVTLVPGDEVFTFDKGVRRLREVLRLPAMAQAPISPTPHWPIHVPEGALDNRGDLVLLPEQKVLLEADQAELLFGEPFALVPAMALLGWRGIDLCRPDPQAIVVRLGFDGDQIVYASRGVLVACPELALDLDAATEVDYPTLTLTQGRAIVSSLMAEDLGLGLR